MINLHKILKTKNPTIIILQYSYTKSKNTNQKLVALLGHPKTNEMELGDRTELANNISI